MSTLAQPTQSRSSHIDVTGRGLSAAGVLRSEWIKLRSLRSTWWSFGIIVLIEVGMAVLFALTASTPSGTIPAEAVTEAAITVGTVGLVFGQLVIAVLGVLVVSGEYSTGQIRSSFMAVPNRVPVLAAKAAVFAAATFVVAFTSIAASYLVSLPIFVGRGVPTDPSDPPCGPAS